MTEDSTQQANEDTHWRSLFFLVVIVGGLYIAYQLGSQSGDDEPLCVQYQDWYEAINAQDEAIWSSPDDQGAILDALAFIRDNEMPSERMRDYIEAREQWLLWRNTWVTSTGAEREEAAVQAQEWAVEMLITDVRGPRSECSYYPDL